MTTSLAHRATIQALVSVYQAECEKIRRAFADIAEAERNLDAAFLCNRAFRVDPSYEQRGGDWGNVERAIQRLRGVAWRAVVERLELRRVMSVHRWEEGEKWLQGSDLPDFTLENVENFVRTWAGSIPDMWTEAVREVFEFLRPRYSKHKTNSQLEIPPKVILTSVCDTGLARYGIPASIDYRCRPDLAAVERVFRGLDGKGQTLGAYYSDLEGALEASAKAAARGEPADRETEYFRVRVFANGNAHIWFRRLDLLAKLNAKAGGMRLRPGKVA